MLQAPHTGIGVGNRAAVPALKEPQSYVCELSRSVVSDSGIPWTVALQAPLSMGFSRKEF